MFTQTTAPLVLRSGDFEIQLKPILELSQFILRKTHVVQKERVEGLKEEFKEIYSDTNEFGTFQAFNDFSIKIKFADRTMVRLQKGSQVAKILTNTGESLDAHIDKNIQFQDYIQTALEFYEWAFASPEERLKI